MQENQGARFSTPSRRDYTMIRELIRDMLDPLRKRRIRGATAADARHDARNLSGFAGHVVGGKMPKEMSSNAGALWRLTRNLFLLWTDRTTPDVHGPQAKRSDRSMSLEFSFTASPLHEQRKSTEENGKTDSPEMAPKLYVT